MYSTEIHYDTWEQFELLDGIASFVNKKVNKQVMSFVTLSKLNKLRICSWKMGTCNKKTTRVTLIMFIHLNIFKQFLRNTNFMSFLKQFEKVNLEKQPTFTIS